MVTQISLGTFGTQNGKDVLTGGASKIDTKGLVESLSKAKRAPAVRLETANKTIDTQTKSLGDLKTLLAKLQTASDTLRNPPGVGTDSKNIFQYRTATLSSSTGATASNYVDVTIQPGAAAQSYTIDSITQLALQTKQQSNLFAVANSTTASAVTAAATPGLFTAGTVNLRAVDGTVGGIALTLAVGDSLETVASKFNELSSRTGIQASVLTVSSGSYKLVFSATKTGTTYGFDLGATAPTPGAGVQTDPSGVLSQLTFGGAGSQIAQDAIFSVDGVSLTRETNSIADALSGVTFTLKQPTIPGTIKVDIQPDTTLVANAITQFADAYNELKIFAATQVEVGDDGLPKQTAVLYNNGTFRTLVDSVSSEVSRIVAGITGTNPSQLRDVGITLENFAGDDKNPATKNILTVDSDKLKSTLLANFDGVRKVFEYRQTSDNSNFLNSKRSNNLTATNFTVSIDTTLGVYTATYIDPTLGSTTVNLTATPITGGGIALKGQSGTIFDGTEYVYAVSGNATINVQLTQGFGDRFYNLVNNYTDPASGLLTNEVISLSDKKTRNETEITTIDDQIAKYRDQLINQYARLESAISSANSLLQLLDAQSNARNNG
jgi:flagellar hook-associated protein 2